MDSHLKFCHGDLELIKKRTLRDIICDNTDVKRLPRSVFQVPSVNNPMVDCQTMRRLLPSQLCLFGASTKAVDLKSAGYVSDSLKGDVAILAGGFDGGKVLSSVETFSPDGLCNVLLPPLPLPSYGSSLFYVNHGLLSCGGNGGHVCFSLVRSANGESHWIYREELSLRKSRFFGATAVSNNGVVYFR